MKQIILTHAPTFASYSIEAGRNDDVKHFDHHGDDMPALSPCARELPLIGEDDYIEITHVDVDSLISCWKMLGMRVDLSQEELKIISAIDTNGALYLKSRHPDVYAYWTGVLAMAKGISYNPKEDITEEVKIVGSTPPAHLIELGKKAIADNINVMKLCLRSESVGLFYQPDGVMFAPELPYEFGYYKYVIYREKFKSISLCQRSDKNFEPLTGNWCDVLFVGHANACGSPRGDILNFEKAQEIYLELKNK